MRNELRYYEPSFFEKVMYLQEVSVCSQVIYRLFA